MRPTFTRSVPAKLALLSAVLTLILESNVSVAQTPNTARTTGPAVSARPQIGQMLEYTVCGSAATFPLDVSARSPAMVELPLGFDKYLPPKETTWDIKRDGSKLYIVPPQEKAKWKAEPEFAVRIRASNPVPFEATLHARVVPKVRDSNDNVIIHHQQDETRFGKRPEDNPCVLRALNPVQRLRIRAFDRQHGEPRAIGVPEIENVVRSGSGFPIELSMYELEAGNLVLDFNANNRHMTTAALTDIRVTDKHGDEVASKIWYWDESGQPIEDESLAIAGFDDVRASIHIPNADKHDLEPMLIEFRGTKGAAPFVTTVQVGTFRHLTPEEVAQLKRDEELRRQNAERQARAWERTRRSRQLSITVHGLAGGYWLSDGAEQGMMSATSTTGVAVRITKGLFPNLAFEGEAVGGRTGSARFRDVSWNNMQGDIARQASFGRAQMAGVVRFGDKYVVSTRVGLAVQAASYDSEFSTTDASMTGPGSSFELDLLLSLGTGFEARIGNHWTIGAGAGFSRAFDGPRVLEAGLHAGYRWLP